MVEAYPSIALLILALVLTSCTVLVVLIAAAFIAWFTYRNKQLRQEMKIDWAPLTRETGLAVQPSGLFNSPVVGGRYRGRDLALIYAGRDNTDTFTKIRLTLNIPGVQSFNIRRPGFIGKVVKPETVDMSRPGDAPFDKLILISSKPPEVVDRFLKGNPRARDILLSFHPRWFMLDYKPEQLIYREMGAITDKEKLEKLFEQLSDLADEFCRL